MITRLRPTRTRHQRAQVAHLFADETAWFPWRSALCGRELEDDRLTARDVDAVPLCVQCQKHAARMGVAV